MYMIRLSYMSTEQCLIRILMHHSVMQTVSIEAAADFLVDKTVDKLHCSGTASRTSFVCLNISRL